MLLCEAAQAKASLPEFLAELSSSPSISDDHKAILKRVNLKYRLERLMIDNQCKGFTIDGDLAVNLSGNFANSNPYEETSRSGMVEFMPDDLIIAATMKRAYLQCPADDIASFFFVALWAAVYHGDDTELGVPSGLQEFRCLVACDYVTRAYVVLRISRLTPLRPQDVGDFLVKCQTFLRLWDAKVQRLIADWIALMGTSPDTDTLEEHFCNFYDRALLDYSELLDEKYPCDMHPA